jgi:putative membrane-bound dehydrogenase-like protein
MLYYGLPTRLAPGVEDAIVNSVHTLLPKSFAAVNRAEEAPAPKPPVEALATLKVRPGLRVERVACEPLVASPVAIDFGPDGRLWVVEMNDYPLGLDGRYKPGGRVKYLEDANGDGSYDKATTLADDLPFPTGVMAWRGGALVCAAPDILYIEDTKRDGKADVRQVLFTGFATENYQARVNGLSYGLDNWVYGANGLLGGTISSRKQPGAPAVSIGGRDFRMNPDTGAFEAVAGLTQQGRVRDDAGNWFGNDSGHLLWHYPLPDYYVRRNPHLAGPSPRVHVPTGDPDPNRLFPISRILSRFNDPHEAGRVTSACGAGLYRDELLGREFKGDAFTCEPVHNLVTRRKLEGRGTTFAGRRAADEQASEFLAATDNWFRPVQVRTGPDGALWVVDMYRFVVEHPRWIPPERLANLDTRAGAERGRIYRIVPEKASLRAVPHLDKLPVRDLVAILESPNGVQRDMAQQELVRRQDKDAVSLLRRLVESAQPGHARLHALCTLDGLGALDGTMIRRAVRDADATVRRHAVRLAEARLPQDAVVGRLLVVLADDPDAQVRLQVACSLGAWPHPDAGRALGWLALRDCDDEYLTAAVFSSLTRHHLAAFAAVLHQERGTTLYPRLFTLAIAWDQRDVLFDTLARLVEPSRGRYTAQQITLVKELLDSLNRRQLDLSTLASKPEGSARAALDGLARFFAHARKTVADGHAPAADRLAAVQVLGHEAGQREADVLALGQLLTPQSPPALQTGAVHALAKIPDARVATLLLAGWKSYGPALRTQVLDVIMRREAWAAVVLDELERHRLTVADFDAVRRQRLLDLKDPPLRGRAAALLRAGTSPDREHVVQRYQVSAKLTGDVGHGRQVFQKNCATCHRISDLGHAVGPDLAAVSDKSPGNLLIAILDPNRTVDAGSMNYVAVTKQGLVFSGLLATEAGNSVTLLAADGKQQVILRSDLDELQNTGKSLMPDGLERDIAPQEMADLMAFLNTTNRPRRRFAGNQPAISKPAADGSIRLPAAAAEIYGDSLEFEQPYRNLGMWHARTDQAVWTIDIPGKRRYQVVFVYACDNPSAGNTFLLQAGGAQLSGRVPGTAGWSLYRNWPVGELLLDAGRHRLVVQPAEAPRGALMDLQEIQLNPLP